MASSFTRWFISQFGMPPAAWRAQKQGSAKASTDAVPPKIS
jgi:AraC-like DNA-binding protein